MYKYQPYPKCLYHADGRTLIVSSEDEAIAQEAEGFLTADQLAEAEALPQENEPAAAEPAAEPGAPAKKAKKATKKAE